MGVFDIILIGVVLIAAIVGFFRGFIYQFLTLFAALLSFVLSAYAALPIVHMAEGNDLIGEIYVYYLARIVSGSVIYFLLSILVWYVDQRSRDAGIKNRFSNRLIGAALGSVKGGAIALALLLGLTAIPAKKLEAFLPVVSRSKAVQFMQKHEPVPYAVIEKNLETMLSWLNDPKQAEKLTDKLQSRGIQAGKRVKDLKERNWLGILRDSKFFDLLKDPNLFAKEPKTSPEPESQPVD